MARMMISLIAAALLLSGCATESGNKFTYTNKDPKRSNSEAYAEDWDSCQAEGYAKYKTTDDSQVPYFFQINCLRKKGWQGLVR